MRLLFTMTAPIATPPMASTPTTTPATIPAEEEDEPAVEDLAAKKALSPQSDPEPGLPVAVLLKLDDGTTLLLVLLLSGTIVVWTDGSHDPPTTNCGFLKKRVIVLEGDAPILRVAELEAVSVGGADGDAPNEMEAVAVSVDNGVGRMEDSAGTKVVVIVADVVPMELPVADGLAP